MDFTHVIAYLNSHWLVITLVWAPAVNGYWNAFIASAKVMGWDRLAVWCGKVEEAIQVFVTTLRNQRAAEKKSSTLNFILLLAVLSVVGCTYISKTSVNIHATKASYPLGPLSSITLENGEVTINREMNAEGLFKK